MDAVDDALTIKTKSVYVLGIDEKERMSSLKYSLKYWIGGTTEQVHTFIYEHAEGTTEELIQQYKKWLQNRPENDLPY